MSATSGTDYHGSISRGLVATTFLGCDASRGEEAASGGAAVEALRRGRAIVSLGPLVSLELERRGVQAVYGLGDLVPPGEGPLLARAEVDLGRGMERWANSIQPESVAFRWRGGCASAELASDGPGRSVAELELPRAAGGWVRAELVGRARGKAAMLAFTNPVYLA